MPSPVRVLIVDEDDAFMRDLSAKLSRLGHEVTTTTTARQATNAIATHRFDIILLDRLLPGSDGIKLLGWMRGEGVNTPVILVTALGRLSERVEGLDAGADDYVVKPFEFDELAARIRAVLRRGQATPEDASVIVAGDISISLMRHRAFRAGQPIDLHKTELKLLAELARNAGSVVERATLLDRVWGEDDAPTTNIVDAYIRRLRLKLDVQGLPDPIATIRGVGYMLRG